MSSADFGLNAKLELGSMDKDFKKKVSKKYAAKWGGIWLGAYNGSGYNKSEVNDNKVVEAGIYIRPLNMIKFLKGSGLVFNIWTAKAMHSWQVAAPTSMQIGI